MAKLTFLGGADEVGASCTLLEISGRRLLVDCGIRMNAPGNNLPWLSPIQELGGIDAIILTHAHMDHLGAMPLIHQSYPHVPIYMTPATLTLGTILLMDSLKIMQMELEQEGEVPLYPLHAVEMMLGATRPVPFGRSIDILDGDIRLTFTPAGHILGAAAVYVEGTDASLLMSGDISVTPQKTIPGMYLPRIKPDLVVAESTYGGRMHANRAAEEHRLVEQVSEVIDRRGSILFPAFAVGRAQEIILLLSQAMEQKRMRRVPIFVDGMVRSVCNAYASYPDLLSPWLKKRAQKVGNPFFFRDSPAQPVNDPRTRKAAAQTRPGIIVSSSGMLSGGPSPVYARQLIDDPANHIAITGYQDEESPGRAIQEVARAGGGQLRLNNEEVRLDCSVGTYGLSAHADTAQIVSAMCSFAPAQVALVHGEGGAREALRDALHQAQVKTVHLPTIGSSIEVTNIKTTFYPKKKASKGERKEPFAHKNLPELGEMIRAQKTPGRLYTVQELLVLWGDAEGAQNDNELLRVATVLDSKNSPFKKDKKRPFLYTLRKHFRSAKKGDAEEEKSGPLDPASAMQRVDAYLSKKDGLYKRSGHNQRQTLVLSFNFPKRAKELHKAVIDQLKVETGWEIELRETPNQQALMELVHRLLPSDAKLEKTPSLHLQEEKIVVQLATALPIPSLQAIADQYLEKTGFQLAFKGISLTPPPQEPPPSEETEAPDAPKVEQTTRTEAPSTDDVSVSSTSSLSIPDLPDASSPQELNQAYQLIRNVFTGAEHELLKVGQKGQALEVTFISPYVGERYADALAKLSKIVGWEIKIRPRSDQHKIKEIAKQLIPEEWGLRKEPGFHQDQATIKAKISVEPPAGEAEALNTILQQKTGFSLEFDVKK